MFKKIFKFYFIKVLALTAANCFLLTSVYGQTVSYAIESFRQTQTDFDILYPYGKITSSNFFSSDALIINIQDLHVHPQVQKNIAKIIEEFDRRYGVEEVYLEGAYGRLDTSWLYEIDGGDKVREELLDGLIKTGRLTGAEYYSAKSRRAGLIKGLENKKAYFNNLKRFSKIIDAQKEIKPLVDDMEQDVTILKKAYYGRKQKKLDKLSQKHKNNKISQEKYFKELYKYAKYLNIDIYKYENINSYRLLSEIKKEIDFKKTSKELNVFINSLKNILPYLKYSQIARQTNNFSDSVKVCAYVLHTAQEYNMDLNKNYPNLLKLAQYTQTAEKINPLDFVDEEDTLLEEILESFYSDESEKDVVFLVNFARRLKDFLSSEITARDYAYYSQNKEMFKTLWAKYVGNDKIDRLLKYETLAEKFYRTNEKRNEYFLSNISEFNESKTLSNGAFYGQDEENAP
ncbi:MAG: hypothetical protein LBU09_02165, partial [Endomicrobium sp.]|nr:hypothetical protein [Endomicrobium sp.]